MDRVNAFLFLGWGVLGAMFTESGHPIYNLVYISAVPLVASSYVISHELGAEDNDLWKVYLTVLFHAAIMLWVLWFDNYALNIPFTLGWFVLAYRSRKEAMAKKAEKKNLEEKKERIDRIIPPMHDWEVLVDVGRFLERKTELSAFVFKYGYYFCDEIFAPVLLNHADEVEKKTLEFDALCEEFSGEEDYVWEMYNQDKRKMYNNELDIPLAYYRKDGWGEGDSPLIVDI